MNAFDRPVTISSELKAVIGDIPFTRGAVTKSVWDYVKANNLQDPTNKRMINADDKLRPIFNGRDRVSMFEMTQLVSKHIS